METAVHGAFNAGMRFQPKKVHKRDLPDLPKTLKDLSDHPYRDAFQQSQKEHLASHDQMGSFIEVPWTGERPKGITLYMGLRL